MAATREKSAQKTGQAPADFFAVFGEFVARQGSDTNHVMVESRRILDAIRARSGKKWKVSRLPVATALLVFVSDFRQKKTAERFQGPLGFLENLLTEKANELHAAMHELFLAAAAPEQQAELTFPSAYIPEGGLDRSGLAELVNRELTELERTREILGEKMPKGMEAQCPAQFKKVQNIIKLSAPA